MPTKPISFDSIQPTSSVTVTSSSRANLVEIEFARVLDQDVLVDMQKLETRPFVTFLFLSCSQKTFDLNIDPNYPLQAVAEAIAQMLEGHGYQVKRLVEPGIREEVNSFTTQ